jgi:hypothetical protein
MKIKHIQFTEKLIDLVEETMEKKGYPTFSSVVHQAIIFFYDKNVNPPYLSGASETNPEIAKKKARAKVEAKIEAEKIKTEGKINEKIALCENLFKGEVQDGVCVFKSYGLEEEDDTIGRIQLDVLHEDYFENNVFFPDQEKVFARRPNVAKIWKQK